MATKKMKIAKFAVGVDVQFMYNAKERVGTVDKIGTSENGDWFTLELYNGTFRCFTLSKCDSLAVISFS